MNFTYLFIFPILVNSVLSNTCSVDNTSCEKTVERPESKYTKNSNSKYVKYLKAIDEAEAKYAECILPNCECFKSLINKDLKPFKLKGINKDLIDESKNKGTFYQIIDGNLYRESDCLFPSRCAGIEHFILKSIANISDIDLVINTRDYPQSSIHFGKPLPIFSFSKTPHYNDITYPAWAFWEGGPAISLHPRGIGRWDLLRKSLIAANKKTPWEKKQEILFFRGSRTSTERDNLILLSRNKPNLVDAAYTKNQAWKSDEDTLHYPPAAEVSFETHCAYKYLINYRGVAASFRHKHLFLCGSLVFHVGDEWTEFYYHAMKPWIHYVPVPKNASQSQIEELVQFVKDNDELAKKIAHEGYKFISNKLTLSNVTCYWKKLLQRYAKIFKYKPSLNKSMIKIKLK